MQSHADSMHNSLSNTKLHKTKFQFLNLFFYSIRDLSVYHLSVHYFNFFNVYFVIKSVCVGQINGT